MKILVTGSSGFIGSNLIQALKKENQIEVIGLGNNRLDGSGIENTLINDLVEADWDKILECNPDVILHCAGPSSAVKSFDNLFLEVRNSVVLTTIILEKIKYRKIKLIYFSSAAVYGDQKINYCYEEMPCNPNSPYGICKLTCEQLIKAASNDWGLDYVILRPFSVYGQGLKKQVIYDLAKRILEDENPLRIQSTGEELRDFVHIDDLCRIVCAIIADDSINKVAVNIGTGRPVKIKKLIEIISVAAGFENKMIFSQDNRKGNPNSLVADTTLLKKYKLHCNIRLENGIQKLINNLRENLRFSNSLQKSSSEK